MSPQRVRGIAIATVAAAFLTVFLGASGMDWRPALLAGGGIASIAGLLLVVLHLVEANDAKAAAANIARCRAAEADQERRPIRGDLIA